MRYYASLGVSLTVGGAWQHIAGPVDGSLACAEAAIVAGWGVVAQALGKLHPSSAGARARAPLTP